MNYRLKWKDFNGEERRATFERPSDDEAFAYFQSQKKTFPRNYSDLILERIDVSEQTTVLLTYQSNP